jgi:DNA polymerase
LVENITQGLSRIPLFDQMLEINRYVVQDGGRVVLNVHDEVIAVVPEETAEKNFEQMLHIMRQPPAWCHDLPLDAEGGYSRQYDK